MKRCPFCAEAIQDRAIVCKHCGRDLPAPTTPTRPPRKRWPRPVRIALWTVGGVLVVLYALVMYDLNGPTPGSAHARVATPKYSEAQRAGIIQAVDHAIANGTFTEVDWKLNKAYIRPLAWRGATAKEKEGVARMLAAYCEVQGDVARITIYDAMSAKELGGISAGQFYVK